MTYFTPQSHYADMGWASSSRFFFFKKNKDPRVTCPCHIIIV